MQRQLLRPPTLTDIFHIASHMRQADVNECKAMAGMGPELALTMSNRISTEVHTMVSPSGEPVGMCGLAPGLGPNDRQVWMLATPVVERYPTTFLRHSRAWIEDRASQFVLWNWVDARNELHVRWLTWLGASFNGSKVSPYTGTKLLHFTKVNPCA